MACSLVVKVACIGEQVHGFESHYSGESYDCVFLSFKGVGPMQRKWTVFRGACGNIGFQNTAINLFNFLFFFPFFFISFGVK